MRIPGGQTVLNALGHPGYFGITWRSHVVAGDCAFLIDYVEAVQCHGMEMDVEIQRIPKALHDADGAAASLAIGGGDSCPAADRGKYCTHEDLEYVADQGRVVCEAIAEGERERKHPLADRHFGEDTVHEMGGSVGHSATAAGSPRRCSRK